MKKLHYNERYRFDYHGNFKTVDHPTVLNKDTRELIIDIGFGEKLYRTEWLGLLAHYEVNVPKEYLKEIDFVEVDSKLLRLKCRRLMVFSKPIPSWWSGFFVVPGFPHYSINLDGDVLSNKTGKILTSALNPYGYPSVNLYDPDKGLYRMVVIHLLYARVFVHNPEPAVKLFVNHENGIKTDLSVKNLTWVTSQENNDHAAMEGLSSKQNPFMIMDHQSGEVTIVHSLSEAFRWMGFTRNRRWSTWDGEKDVPVLFSGRYELQPLNDNPKPWYHGDMKVQKVSKGPYQAKRLSDEVVLEADTVDELSKLVNIPRDTLFYYLNGRSDLNRRGFLFREKTDKPWPVKIRSAYSAERKSLEVEDIDGVKRKFSSVSEASKMLNIDRGTIRKYIDSDHRINGWLIKRYVSPLHS